MLSSLSLLLARLPLWGMLPALPQVSLDTSPVCMQGASADQCTSNLIGVLGNPAHGLYTLGIWTCVIVAVLVIVWTTPGAILQASGNNSRVVALFIGRIGIIFLLVLFAFNSWSLLQWMLGLIQHQEPSWTLPLPVQGTPVPLSTPTP